MERHGEMPKKWESGQSSARRRAGANRPDTRNAQQNVNAVEKPLPGRGRPSITSSHQGNLLCLIAVLQQSNQKRGATPATRRQPPMPPPPRPLFGAFSIGNLGRRI